MLQTTVVGNVGAAPTTQSNNGKEFTTFRVAHNDSWKDDAGVTHTNVIWVDCIMNGRPNVVEYLKPGTQVFITGDTKTRVYSSQKDRCMKAGLTISVRTIELLGGKRDEIPSRLYDQNGAQHDVTKYYHTDMPNSALMSQQGRQFITDENGWVTPLPEPETPQNDDTEPTPETF